MASFYKRGGTVRAVIRIKGYPTKTMGFSTLKDAKLWASITESKMSSRRVFGAKMTLAEIFARYMREVEATRPYAEAPKRDGGPLGDGTPCLHGTPYPSLIKRFPNVEIKDMDRQWYIDNIGNMKSIPSHRNKHTAKPLSPASRARHMAAISTALQFAKEWGANPDFGALKSASEYMWKRTRQLGAATKRTRRLMPGEYERIKAHVERERHAGREPVPVMDVIDFAVLTGLRASEIARIQFSDVTHATKGPMLMVRDRKHPKEKIGNHSTIPLLGDALQIIERQPRRVWTDGTQEDRIFPWASASIGQAFEKACTAVGIKDLHLHDLRHEAISRLFEVGYKVPQVAQVSGHKDWKNLARYTNLDAEDLHDGPAGRWIQPPPPSAPAVERPRLYAVK